MTTKARQHLTDGQRRVYDFLLAYTLEHHQQPTVREVARHYGCFHSYAHDLLQALIKKGWLERVETGTACDRWRFAGVTFTATQEAPHDL